MKSKIIEKPKFTIDPEFQNLLPHLNKEARDELRERLRKEGCRDRLVTCRIDGILTLIDGYTRRDICEELGIAFDVKEIKIPSRTEAKIWIIRNQRGKRNLTDSQWAMVAVELEELYGKWAKEKESQRKAGQDLKSTFPNLEKSRSIHAAKMAAKDIGISHQTVSSAKKVVKEGIPELKKIVEDGHVAVSQAAKVASCSDKIQKRVIERAVAQIQEGKKPKISAILREISPKAPKNDPDELLEAFRKNHEENQRILEGITKTQRPENLVEMIYATERIATKLKELEAKSLKAEVRSRKHCVIEMRHFKTFIESIVPISEKATLSFDDDGVRVKAKDLSGDIVVEAFLPRAAFSRYEKLGKIRLSDTARLRSFISICSNSEIMGKQNLLIYADTGNNDKIFGKLYCLSANSKGELVLENPSSVEDIKFPEIVSTCKVNIDGKEFVKALKPSIALNGIGYFLVSEKSFRVVCREKLNDKDVDVFVAKPHCEVSGDGADSAFEVDKLIKINPIIEKSRNVTLSLGMNQPLIMDLAIDGMEIKYHVRDKEVKKAKKKRTLSSS
jgi:hypothetical protein